MSLMAPNRLVQSPGEGSVMSLRMRQAHCVVLIAALLSCSALPLGAEPQRQPQSKKLYGKRCGTSDIPNRQERIDEANWRDYVAKLDERVKSAWVPPRGSYNSAVLKLEIGRSGRILDTQFEKTSGDEAFDKTVLAAVKTAIPLPELPQPRQKEKATAHLNFTNSIETEQARDRLGYLKSVQSAVLKHWVLPAGSAGRQGTVGFRLDKTGQISHWRIEDSSGDVDFNKSALDAIKVAAPHSPFPKALLGAEVAVELTFSRQDAPQISGRVEVSEPGSRHHPEVIYLGEVTRR